MPIPAQEFVTAFAQQLSDYSGRDVAQVSADVRYGGDNLPLWVTDLLTEDLRAYIEDPARPDLARFRPVYESARQSVMDLLRRELPRATRPDTGFVTEQLEAPRAHAGRVFATAVGFVDSTGTQTGEPRSLDRQRALRAHAALESLHGLPEDRRPDLAKLAQWQAAAEDIARSDRPGRRESLAAEIDGTLERAAGYLHEVPRSGTRAEDLLRAGTAIAWTADRQLDFKVQLGVAGVLGRTETPGSDRFEGRLAASFAQGVAAASGRPAAYALERFVAEAHRHGRDQWAEAGRILVPDGAVVHASHVDLAYARSLVKNAMRDELLTHYGNPDRMPDLTPEEVGLRAAAAGTAMVGELSIDLPTSPVLDPDLESTVAAASDGVTAAGGRTAYSAATLDPDQERLIASVERGPKTEGHSY
ncbi:hypothetical protein AB0E69_26980 [Kribbella sp. NPDC026611]|uniref:hypothetical protein n=1 Tax=Kribbella sp. NPDC026611 TaxID=3154911 RepID=UPI0033DD20E4